MDKLVTEREMAAMLDVSVSTLQKDRFQYTLAAGKNRIPFVMVGVFVRYRPSLVFAVVTAGKADEASKKRYANMHPDFDRKVIPKPPTPRRVIPVTIRPPTQEELAMAQLTGRLRRPKNTAFTQLTAEFFNQGESK